MNHTILKEPAGVASHIKTKARIMIRTLGTITVGCFFLLLGGCQTTTAPDSLVTEYKGISDEVNNQLRQGNWEVLARYHWAKMYKKGGVEEQAIYLNIEQGYRQAAIDAKKSGITVIQKGRPNLVCSIASPDRDFALFLESSRWQASRSNKKTEYTMEYVYAKDRGEWYVFENNENLERNLNLAGVVKMYPRNESRGRPLPVPRCVKRFKLGKHRNGGSKWVN